MTQRTRQPWWINHSLSLVVGFGVLIWAALYRASDPKSHLGAFFGNSIADWLGSFVTIVATKFWFEKGSVESRLPHHWRRHARHAPDWLRNHSLTVVLVVTWIAWITWYARLDPGGRAGEVVGNIVSEWGQTLSLVWFTKYLYERGSKESR